MQMFCAILGCVNVRGTVALKRDGLFYQVQLLLVQIEDKKKRKKLTIC